MSPTIAPRLFPLALAAAALLLGACRAPRPFDGRRNATPVPLTEPHVEIPFAEVNGIVMLPTLVDGQGPFEFALDTGATTVVIGEATVDRVGLRTEERSATLLTELGERLRTVEQTHLRELRVGAVRTKNVGALVADLLPLSRTIGRSLDGILGMTVLRHHVWTVDLTRNVLTVSDEELPEPDGVNVLALDLSSELPEVEIEIAGRRMKALLDTGQRAPLALSPEDARPLRGLMEIVGTSVGQVLDGRVDRELARLSTDVRIGGIVLERPSVILANGTRVGLGAFAGRVFTFDLTKGRLRLH